jgi:hypothetical protein
MTEGAVASLPQKGFTLGNSIGYHNEIYAINNLTRSIM